MVSMAMPKRLRKKLAGTPPLARRGMMRQRRLIGHVCEKNHSQAHKVAVSGDVAGSKNVANLMEHTHPVWR